MHVLLAHTVGHTCFDTGKYGLTSRGCRLMLQAAGCFIKSSQSSSGWSLISMDLH
jgi:hypothetical protein